MKADIFNNLESEVRSYCRKYPTIFHKAINAELFDEDNRRYIDFLASAGSLNYGHNNKEIKSAIVEYLREDNPINMLDMYTTAKEEFLRTFNNKILKPRNLNYKMMLCGPTGTNGVEAALKLARKNTGRSGVVAFGGAFHGMTLGSLACTTDRTSRYGAGVPLDNVTHIPYDSNGYVDSLQYLRWILEDDHSGIDKPAAVILETIQAEGGVNIASKEWLRGIRKICTDENIILIVDDIQVGVGRSGDFFSFERAGITPDLVVMSKSISGFGMPMSILLISPELDIFKPAEHNGTFRGYQLSFVGGTASFDYFTKYKLDKEVKRKEVIVSEYLKSNICMLDARIDIRGIGLIWGIDFNEIGSEKAMAVVHKCFENGLICEVAGRKDGVLKIMPPLTIEDDVLVEGLNIVKESIRSVL